MRKPIAFCLLLAASVFASTSADAALNAYLKMSGQKTGKIEGSVTQKGREGKIMVIAVDHDLKSENGRKTHGVFTITKELDKSSPQLYKMWAAGDTAGEFELQFWSPQIRATTGVGQEVQHYTVKLTGAKIAAIKFRMANNKNPELTRFAEYEEISFTYESISWTWTDGNIQANDSVRQ